MTPYASATSGHAARDEITKMLRRFGCESVGFMDDFENYSVLLAFKHRGRQLQLQASAKGWAALYLKENPGTQRRSAPRTDRRELHFARLGQGTGDGRRVRHPII